MTNLKEMGENFLNDNLKKNLGHFYLIGGIFFKKLGANVLVEYKNVFLIRGIFYNWGNFFPIWGNWGKCVSGI